MRIGVRFRRMARLAAAVAGMAASLAGREAAAEAPPPPIHLRLDHQVAPDLVKACFNAKSFHDRVYVELEYGPFAPPFGDGTLEVRAVRDGSDVEVSWKIVPPSPRLRQTDYRGKAKLCSEAMTDAIAALAYALPPPPPLLPPPPSRSPRPPATRPPPPPPSDMKVGLGAAAGLRLGSTPGLSLGLSLDAGLRWRRFSLALEARAALPASKDVGGVTHVPGERLSAWMLSAALVPCARWGMLLGCGLVEAGAFHAATTGTTVPTPSTGAYVAAGGRAGAEIPMGKSRASLRFTGDLTGALVRGRATFAKPGDAWEMAPVNGAVSGGIVVVF